MALFLSSYHAAVHSPFFSTQWQEVVQISAGLLKKRAREKSWVVVVLLLLDGVAGGGCNERYSKITLLTVSSWTEESFQEEKEGFRPQLGRSGTEGNKLKMSSLRMVLLLILGWTCQGWTAHCVFSVSSQTGSNFWNCCGSTSCR